MRIPSRLAPLAPLVPLAMGALLAACATAPGPETPDPVFVAKRSELLLLAPEPCSRLVVQVEAIEGSEVLDLVLEEVRATLAETCSKPGGIRVEVGEPVPPELLRERPHELVALGRMEGPPEDAADTAFLYVLVDDTDRTGRPPYEPEVRNEYRAAVFYDDAFVRQAAATFPPETPAGEPWLTILRRECLRHELGHCLGLVSDPRHGRGAHCTDERCRSAAVLTQAMRRAWCADCTADLARGRASGTPGFAAARARFHGPLLVREEEGYWVAYLPGYVAIRFRDPLERPWRAQRKEALAAGALHGGEVDTTCEIDLDPPPGHVLEEDVARVLDDPDPLVRSTARNALRALAARERATGSTR